MLKSMCLICSLLVCLVLHGQVADSIQNSEHLDTITAKKMISRLIAVSQSFAQNDQFQEAYDSIDRAEKIALQFFGAQTAIYAQCLNIHGMAQFYAGDYKGAEKSWVETKTIRKACLKPYSSDYCASLINLGALYFELGKYELAEEYYLEAKTNIEHQENFQSNPWFLNLIGNLGGLYYTMGNTVKATKYLSDNLTLHEKNNGKSSIEYASSLTNLSVIYFEMDDMKMAFKLMQEAIDIIASKLGTEHSDYASNLSRMGSLFMKTKEYVAADSVLQRSLDINARIFGLDHAAIATVLLQLGDLNIKLEKYDQANRYISQAKSILEKHYGKEHPDYLIALGDLAKIYTKTKRFDETEYMFKELCDLKKRLLQKAFNHLSERELELYVNSFSNLHHEMLSFVHDAQRPNLIPECYDNSLFYKGFLLNSANQIKKLDGSDPLVSAKYNDLQILGRRLAKEYSYPLADQDSLKIAELEEGVNRLEKELIRMASVYQVHNNQIHWKDVQHALKPGEAAIEFIDFNGDEVDDKNGNEYAAMVLRADATQPVLYYLCRQNSLEALIKAGGQRKVDYVNQLYKPTQRGATEMDPANGTLFELVWKPLMHGLKGIHTIYYSPTGLLHRINLAAITLSEDSVMADQFRLIAMNSTRQLVMHLPNQSTGGQAVFFGGLNFETDFLHALDTGIVAARPSQSIAFSKADSAYRGGHWEYLSGTLKEINAIQQIMIPKGFFVTLNSGNGGTEESFKALSKGMNSPRILHLATHGYFFADDVKEVGHRESRADEDSLEGLANSKKGEESRAEPVFKLSEHPMLRSGLILSGGNAGWQGERSLDEREDGVLTAYEIIQMNLSNTELVVLSACETGLGDIQGNEGVYGLQRAFKIAGVKYIIMSLWQVPDKQTGLLMTTFYKKWLEAEGPDKGGRKMTIPDAFHAAQKELRELGFDPYQWAGFVLIE